MDVRTTDIWFGPGAEKGVFGAGVALGLQESMARGQIDSSQFRLYGSSIGCLNAVFLATGNASCGLRIFQEETQKLVTASNLVPATGAVSSIGLLAYPGQRRHRSEFRVC